MAIKESLNGIEDSTMNFGKTKHILKQVGAQLIAYAKSLTNSAKYSGLSLHCLTTEKDLSHVILKLRKNSPRYGLTFRLNFIGRGSCKSRELISTFLDNKCLVACSIDFFNKGSSNNLKQQVNNILKHYETDVQMNLESIKEVLKKYEQPNVVKAEYRNKKKRNSVTPADANQSKEDFEEIPEPFKKKKKKKLDISEIGGGSGIDSENKSKEKRRKRKDRKLFNSTPRRKREP